MAGRNPTGAHQRAPRPDLPAILGRFAAALSIVETAHRALRAANVRAIGSEESCLEQGVAALQRAYSEVDVAFLTIDTGRAAR